MASKSKRRRKVLGASCILAALIIAGSSFAWFTSKDEVTNRLTATADYGVSIVEDFTPPKAMTPGQTVNKDVSAVNTGSVDAFVRMSIQDYIKMSKLDSKAVTTTVKSAKTYFMAADGSTTLVEKTATVTNESTGALTEPTAETGETKLYSLRTFNDTIAAISDANEAKVELNAMEKMNADGTKDANEVTTLMAGGRVMVAESVAVAPDKQAIRSGDDVNGDGDGYAIIYKNSADSNFYVPGTGSDAGKYKKVTLNDNGLYETTADAAVDIIAANLSVAELARDYSGAGQYTPQNSGIFIFQRTGSNSSGITYSGFYYDKTNGKFYALKTQTAQDTNAAAIPAATQSTAVIDGASITLENLPDGSQVVQSISDLEVLTKKSNIQNSAADVWSFKFYESDKTTEVTGAGINANSTKFIKATFTPEGSTKTVDFWIELDANWNGSWTYVAGSPLAPGYASATGDGGQLGYFYYKTKLESGETSKKLIDSVTLDSAMNSQNYLDLVYDLNVALDSVQVTKDQYGNETAVAVPYNSNSEITTTDTNGKNWATPTLTKSGDGVIDSIGWA